MKFLIYNYGNVWNTEPNYFNAGLSLIEGVQSFIFDPNQSVYDNFDKTKPDVLITRIYLLSRDVLSYISENKKIKLVINCDGSDKKAIDKLSNLLSEMGIDASFFGSEDKNTESKYVKILSGADIFLPKSPQEYSIQKLIFVNDASQIGQRDGTYHFATTNQNIANLVDIFAPIAVLNSIFSNYNEIIFSDGSYIGSQLAFNAIYSGTKVIFATQDNKDLDKIDSIFKGQKLLSSVKNKHTCLHRLKSLLSQLSLNDLANELAKKIEVI